MHTNRLSDYSLRQIISTVARKRDFCKIINEKCVSTSIITLGLKINFDYYIKNHKVFYYYVINIFLIFTFSEFTHLPLPYVPSTIVITELQWRKQMEYDSDRLC